MPGTYIDAFSFTSGPKFCNEVSLEIFPPSFDVASDIRPSYLVTREIHAHCSLPQQMTGKFVLLARDTSYHDITERQTILKSPFFHVLDLVLPFPDAFASREFLYATYIHAVHASTIISEQSSKRPSHHLTSIHHADCMAEESISIWQYGVVDTEVLQYLDHSQRCAWQDALLCLCIVEKPDVLIHVENISVTQTLNIFGNIDYLLQILILSAAEYRIVDNYPVNSLISIGRNQRLLNLVFIHLAECISEATIRGRKISPTIPQLAKTVARTTKAGS